MSTATAIECLSVGSRFGAYVIGDCIGQGAMGQVYRAEHMLLRKTVALKIMTVSARKSSTGHRRFTREARAAAAVKHPNVVDILDMGVLEGLPFIVMEFLEGEDLEKYLKCHGTLTDRQLADLALPIIAAICAVHDAGVMHRDIKPSNIFLAKGSEEDLVPKLLDFGISKSVKGLGESEFGTTGPEDLVGTPLYISPEALRGPKHLTARSDQYSLGVVLYECATGRRTHEGTDLAALVRSILNDPVQPLRALNPSISRELEAAILRALSRRPEDRFEHVQELGAALWPLASKRAQHVWAKRFSDGTGSSGVSPAPATRQSRSGPSQRALVVASSLVVLAALLGSFAWFRVSARAPAPTTAASTSFTPANALPEVKVRALSTRTALEPAPSPPSAPDTLRRASQAASAATPSQTAERPEVVAGLATPKAPLITLATSAASSQPSTTRRLARRTASSRGNGVQTNASGRGAVALERVAEPRAAANEGSGDSAPSSLTTLERAPSESSPPAPHGANESPILD
jgi:eukaryotic-like serine/threonine-protein kinase